MQVVLREKFVGKGSKNFKEIEDICNQQFAQGYRLHTFAQSTAASAGFGGGDRTFVIWFLRKCTERAFLLMLIEGRFNK